MRPMADDGTHPATVDRTKATARREFDHWALSYDRSRLNELVFFPSVRRCQEEILRWKQQRGTAPYRMLDVGCATGTLLSLMAQDPDAELLVGLDYSPVMAQQFADRIATTAFGERLAVVHGDSERLPFADESFDVLTCCNSFHHYPNQAAAVDGFMRVLRPGGLLILIDGFRDNVIGWIVFDFGVASVEKDVHHASWTEFKGFFEAAGFVEIRQQKMNVFAPLLVNVARRPVAQPSATVAAAG